MKPGLLPPSDNVVDQTMSTSSQAPHAAPLANPIINKSKGDQSKAWEAWSQEAQKHVMKLPKDNPFRQLLTATAKFTPSPEGPTASIPIPSPRPDPNEPRPTVFTYPNNKG